MVGHSRSSSASPHAVVPWLAAAGVFGMIATGCARHEPPAAGGRAPDTIAVLESRALTLPAAPLAGAPPRLRIVEIAPQREALAPPPPPTETPEPDAYAPRPLAADDALQPPIPRGPARFTRPAGTARGATWIELDVRVDEHGEVSDAEWAAGSTDTALTAAAIRMALALRYHPAQLRGRPVAVWCRQRLDVER